MKTTIFTVLMAISSIAAFAQLDKAELYLMQNKIADAQKAIDTYLADDANKNNAKALYTKAEIYAAIANDDNLKTTVPDARWNAYEALKLYAAIDPSQALLAKDSYKPLIGLYEGYFNVGAAYYNINNYADAYANFKKGLEIHDYITAQEWSRLGLDTTLVFYTGVTAEKNDKKDEAATHYAQLANAKVNDANYISLYKWLVNYYLQKKDAANAKKHIALGRTIYPKDAEWNQFLVEAAKLSGNSQELYAAYEEALTKDSTNELLLFNYAVELFNTAYSADMQKNTALAQPYINKAQTVLEKLVFLHPNIVNGHHALAMLYQNQALDMQNKVDKFKAKLMPAEAAIKKDWTKKLADKKAACFTQCEKVVEILDAKPELTTAEKGYYKNALDVIAPIYQAKGDKEKYAQTQEKYKRL